MHLKERPYSLQVNLDDTKIILGLFSFVSVAVIQIVSMTNIDSFLVFAEYCFALSLPFLAVLLFIKYAERVRKQWFKSITYTAVYIAAPLASFMGICAIFFHFSPKIGFLFVASAGLSMTLRNKLSNWMKAD